MTWQWKSFYILYLAAIAWFTMHGLVILPVTMMLALMVGLLRTLVLRSWFA